MWLPNLNNEDILPPAPKQRETNCLQAGKLCGPQTSAHGRSMPEGQRATSEEFWQDDRRNKHKCIWPNHCGGVKAKGRHSEIEHRDSASMSPSRETAWWKPSQRRCEWRWGSWKAGVILRGRGQLKRCLQTEGKSGARGCCAWPHCLLCLCTAQECCTFKLLGTQRSWMGAFCLEKGKKLVGKSQPP